MECQGLAEAMRVHMQCDNLLQRCYAHIRTLNGVLQQANNYGVSSIDLSVIQNEVASLTYVVNAVFHKTHPSFQSSSSESSSRSTVTNNALNTEEESEEVDETLNNAFIEEVIMEINQSR